MSVTQHFPGFEVQERKDVHEAAQGKKQREEEDGFTEERIRQKWGTREELGVLQRSSKQEERGQKGAKRE